jgi:hypothetical protein
MICPGIGKYVQPGKIGTRYALVLENMFNQVKIYV